MGVAHTWISCVSDTQKKPDSKHMKCSQEQQQKKKVKTRFNPKKQNSHF